MKVLNIYVSVGKVLYLTGKLACTPSQALFSKSFTYKKLIRKNEENT